MTDTPPLLLYRRAGCHLCDDARSVVAALLARRAAAGHPVPDLREVDIEADPDLEARYAFTIPVLEFGGQRLELATSARRIAGFLARILGEEASAAEAPS